MTSTNTDAAREAGLVALKQFPVLDGRVVRLHSDAAIDAFLSKALEGADEEIAEILERHETQNKILPRDKISVVHGIAVLAHNDRAELLTLVTALIGRANHVGACSRHRTKCYRRRTHRTESSTREDAEG